MGARVYPAAAPAALQAWKPAVATADRMVPLLPRSLTYIAALTTPCAIDYLAKYHPDADVVAASLEEGVNERGEVIPGFGDVGQRLYGTA